MKLLLTLIILASTSTMGLAQSGSVSLKTVPVDATFQQDLLRWNRGPAGVEFRWKTIPIEGDLHVCGALKYTGHGQRRISTMAVRDAQFMLSQFEILRDGSFFPEVARNAAFEGAAASCKSTGVKPPRGDFPIWIRFPRKGYR